MFKKVNLCRILFVTILMISCTPDLMVEEYPIDLQELNGEQNDVEPDVYDDTGDDQSLEPDNEKDG